MFYALTLRFAHVIRAQSLLLFASPASAPQALITLTTVLIEKDALLRYTALLEQFVEVCVLMVDKDDMCGVYMSAVSCCVLPCPFDIAVFSSLYTGRVVCDWTAKPYLSCHFVLRWSTHYGSSS